MNKPRSIPQPNPANLLGLDYKQAAHSFHSQAFGLVDIHTHISGAQSAQLLRQSMDLFGIAEVYSMTALEELPVIKQTLGSRVHFIAIPLWHGGQPLRDHGVGYCQRIQAFYRQGARIAKFWCAPRIYDYTADNFSAHPLRLNAPARREPMQAAADLGMCFMIHVADPDTWFASKYRNARKYGTKLQQYEDLTEVLERFHQPTIAAHLGGYPENLQFLSGLLARYPHLYLDCSATKWMVRELSRQPIQEVQQFFVRWKGRILFGSDIVTTDSHLNHKEASSETERKASSSEEAFDLYASRYWALRTLFETEYCGPSPIADPDLSASTEAPTAPSVGPQLLGRNLPLDAQEWLYYRAAQTLLRTR